MISVGCFCFGIAQDTVAIEYFKWKWHTYSSTIPFASIYRNIFFTLKLLKLHIFRCVSEFEFVQKKHILLTHPHLETQWSMSSIVAILFFFKFYIFWSYWYNLPMDQNVGTWASKALRLLCLHSLVNNGIKAALSRWCANFRNAQWEIHEMFGESIGNL